MFRVKFKHDSLFSPSLSFWPLHNGQDLLRLTLEGGVELDNCFYAFPPLQLSWALREKRWNVLSGSWQFQTHSILVKTCGSLQRSCGVSSHVPPWRVVLAPLCLGRSSFLNRPDTWGHSVQVCIYTGLGAATCQSPGTPFLRDGGAWWILCFIWVGTADCVRQDSPWPLTIQVVIKSPPAQASLDPISLCGHSLSWFCCWAIQQLLGQHREPFWCLTSQHPCGWDRCLLIHSLLACLDR